MNHIRKLTEEAIKTKLNLQSHLSVDTVTVHLRDKIDETELALAEYQTRALGDIEQYKSYLLYLENGGQE